MYYKKVEDVNGPYVDEIGHRYELFCARRIRSACGVAVDYEQFSSLDAALAAWGLSEKLPLAE